MTLNRVSRRKKRPSRRTKRNGGGWSELGKGNFNQIAVSPGNQVHVPFSGAGKDCTGNPNSIRDGYIAHYNHTGLPGLTGGAISGGAKHRGAKRRVLKRHRTHGGVDTKISNSITPKPFDFPNPNGAGGTVGAPGVPMHATTPQKGGRYGFFPEMGPLNSINGVGVSPAPFGRIPCETGTANSLNPNPHNIQHLSTAPLSPPFVSGKLMGGGASNFPIVNVGAADSMRYYAPNAGYRNDMITFKAPSAVPGLLIQAPFNAGAFNQACIKTGGSRRARRGGAQPIAMGAGTFTPVKISEIGTRFSFDGTNKGLPVRFGGRRRRTFKNKHNI